MRRRALLPVAALAAVTTMAASCLSPTLPLPPPDAPQSVTESSTGTWVVSGECEPGAIVSVFNTNTGVGLIVEDLAKTGNFAVSIAGSPCNIISVWQEVDENLSSAVAFQLQAYSQGEPVSTSACGGN
jgi:hypothetical protein